MKRERLAPRGTGVLAATAALLVLAAGPSVAQAQDGGRRGDGTVRPVPRGVLGGVPLSAAEEEVKSLAGRLSFETYKELVASLAEFGDREQGTEGNAGANDWIEAQLRSWGYETERLVYEFRGERREQVHATKVGSTHPGEMYIVGGHMDGRGGGQAVNDNASGTALVLEIARVLGSPDIRTARSVRFALWNNEETGLDGARAYVEQRASLQGLEDPSGSGRYPEPRWLGMIQHDKVMFDHGNPVQPEQVLNADVNIEFQLNSARWEESAALALVLLNANRKFASDYPATMSNSMSNTDSMPFMDLVAAVSIRENRRLYEIGRGSDPHWHRATDVLSTFTDADYRLGFNATQTTFSAVALLAEARVVVQP